MIVSFVHSSFSSSMVSTAVCFVFCSCFILQHLNLKLDLSFLPEKDGESIAESLKTYEDKVQRLEKELFFYKKTSRGLKKKLKELLGEMIHPPPTQSKRPISQTQLPFILLVEFPSSIVELDLHWL